MLVEDETGTLIQFSAHKYRFGLKIFNMLFYVSLALHYFNNEYLLNKVSIVIYVLL